MTAISPGPMTRAELDALPDDGRRHELIDGVLVVTPAPLVRHQHAVMNLVRALDTALPPGLLLYTAPLDVVLGDDTLVQPDLLVARRADFTERDLSAPPLLAVEVLSPSTRRVDLNLKRVRYEAAGCPSYWVFDPDRVELTVWELDGAGYGSPTVVRGDETFRARAPYPVEVTPSRIAAG
ncbi:Uma2 family endonuclease [Nocardioides hungaricus]